MHVLPVCMHEAYRTDCTVAEGEDEKCSSQSGQFHLHMLLVGEYV